MPIPQLRRLAGGAILIASTVGALTLGAPAPSAVAQGISPVIVTVNDDPPLADTACPATQSDPCSLRAAVELANSEGGVVTIEVPPTEGTQYDLTIPPGVDDDEATGNATGDLNITGSVTIDDSGDADDVVIDANQADRDIDVEEGASLTLNSVTLEGGLTTGYGGGIENQGTLSMVNSVIGGDSASFGGGLGVVDAASTSLASVQVADNTATDGDGGGIDITGTPAATTSIIESAINGNVASGSGGAVAEEGAGTFTTTLTQFEQNSASSGGALFANNPSASDNVSEGRFYENTATDGAAIDLESGTLNVSTSAIFQNTATDAGGGLFDAETGPADGSLTLTESSLTNDSASGSAGGGGLALVGCQQVSLVNDTVALDSAVAGGGLAATGCSAVPTGPVNEQLRFDTFSGNAGGTTPDVFVANTEEITMLAESIVADVGTGATSGCAATPAAALASGGNNLATGTFCGPPAGGDRDNTPPALGPLGHHGSPTDSEVPAEGSAAIAAVPGAACAGVTADQNDSPRPAGAGGTCTVGSVEVASPAPTTTQTSHGYRFVATDGGIFDFGGANFEGSTGATTLSSPIVGMASTSDGGGYWLVASDGGIFAFGDAAVLRLDRGIAPQQADRRNGCHLGWRRLLVGGFGTAASFAFGDAHFLGSTGAIHLNKPIVGMAATSDGGGYWLVASDGGIFAFGDAPFDGSTGALHLNKPIVGMAATSDGGGYWLVASDGGIFAFGDAPFDGSTGAIHLNKPIVGMAATSDGGGYWLVASDGGIFAFGDAPFDGSTGALHLNKPIVGMARA